MKFGVNPISLGRNRKTRRPERPQNIENRLSGRYLPFLRSGVDSPNAKEGCTSGQWTTPSSLSTYYYLASTQLRAAALPKLGFESISPVEAKIISQRKEWLLLELGILEGCPGLVDEHQTIRIEIELGIEPVPAPLQDVRAVLLGRVRGLFLNVRPQRSSKVQSVARAAYTSRSAASLSSISLMVMSGVVSTSPRM